MQHLLLCLNSLRTVFFFCGQYFSSADSILDLRTVFDVFRTVYPNNWKFPLPKIADSSVHPSNFRHIHSSSMIPDAGSHFRLNIHQIRPFSKIKKPGNFRAYGKSSVKESGCVEWLIFIIERCSDSEIAEVRFYDIFPMAH